MAGSHEFFNRSGARRRGQLDNLNRADQCFEFHTLSYRFVGKDQPAKQDAD
jgi:hypothetical protein